MELVRPEILALKGYSSARMEAEGGRVLLNANENPWPAVGGAALALNRYPDPQPTALVDALSELYGVVPQELLVTRGSDEAIDLLVRAFCQAGKGAILECPPCFGMYRVSAQIQGAEVIAVPLSEEWCVDTDAMDQAWRPGAHLVFVCSPNNPTGNKIPRDVIVELCERFSSRALVVVDEAYQEFATQSSVVDLIAEHDNLAVLRTLSKAFGLAGVRCGCLIGRPAVIATLRKIMAPYPLPTPSVEAALAALTPEGLSQMHERTQAIVAARSRLAMRLQESKEVVEVWALEANFVLARVRDAKAFVASCAGAGVLVRDVSHYPSLANCVRITVGSPQENAALLACVENDRRAGICQ